MSEVVSKPTVHIIDDDEALTQSYVIALTSVANAKSYRTSSEFLSLVPADPEDGCLIVDLRLDDESGLDLLRGLRLQGWTVPAIIISGTLTVPQAMDAVQYGVFQVLQKPVFASELIRGVLAACEAKRAKVTRGQLLQAVETLSDIERRVFAKMLEGDMNKLMSSRLDISLRSVVRHRKSVIKKLGFSGEAELIREWTHAGLDTSELRIDSPLPPVLPEGVRLQLHQLAQQLRQTRDVDAVVLELERLAESVADR